MTLRYLSPIHKAQRQMALYLEERMAALGVSNPEAHLLSYLASYGPCAVGELRRVLGHKGSTLTSLLDRLEERGLLERRLNPADRRSLLVELSGSGRRVAGRVRRELEALEEAVDERLANHDLEGFRAVLEAIAKVTRVDLTKERSR